MFFFFAWQEADEHHSSVELSVQSIRSYTQCSAGSADYTQLLEDPREFLFLSSFLVGIDSDSIYELDSGVFGIYIIYFLYMISIQYLC